MELLLLTDASSDVFPVLDLLPYACRTVARTDWAAAVHELHASVVLVDACGELDVARTICRSIYRRRWDVALIVVIREAGLAAVTADWGVDDFILGSTGPAEVGARLAMAAERQEMRTAAGDELIKAGELTVDSRTYTATLSGEALALAYREFELLKFLARQPDRVFSREQLLLEVWGHDYFGGTRTVEVHVRRLRAKLGPHSETMIATVRQVGYKFAPRTTVRHRGGGTPGS